MKNIELYNFSNHKSEVNAVRVILAVRQQTYEADTEWT